MLTQLRPQIPLIVLPHGPCPGGNAQAVGVIDYSEEHDLMWVCILDDGGQIWTVPNKHVRGFANSSIGRKA